MSGDDRFEVEELAEIAALPPEHPRRLAIERSARGRALLAAYRSFVAPGDAPPEAGLERAKAQLDAMLARELGLGVPAGSAPTVERRRERSPSPRWSVALRPAFALAAFVVLAGGVWFAAHRPGEPAHVLRGERVGGTGAIEATVTLHAVRVLPGGAIELSWESVPGADRYEVAFFASDLGALGHPMATHDLRLVLAPAALPAGLRHGQHVLWQVRAGRGLEPLAASETAPLQVP